MVLFVLGRSFLSDHDCSCSVRSSLLYCSEAGSHGLCHRRSCTQPSGVFACSACCGFDRSRLCDLCSFISSILRRFPLSETQYSCIISKSLFKVFGLRRSRYSPHGLRLRPAIAASMMVFSSTFVLLLEVLRDCAGILAVWILLASG